MKRRSFVASMLAAASLRAKGRVPIRKATIITKLFKSPDGHPNVRITQDIYVSPDGDLIERFFEVTK